MSQANPANWASSAHINFVQQTTTIYLISISKPIAIPEGLIIGCILRFTGGWAYNWQGAGI